jgi:capsular exopolysaccharide synthesis family protein
LGLDGFPEGLDDRLVSLLTPEAFAAEQYRALRYTVEQLRSHSGLSVVAVSSPSVGDGKTTTAINLAGALAQAPDARILLIEADLRRPSIARRLGLGLPPRPGLVRAILSPDVALESVVRPCPPFNGLSVLLAGSGRSSPYELLHSPRLGELLEEARRRYDYVVLDTPPIVGAPDCQVLAQWVDGMLVVVRAHRTPRKLLEEALNLMEPAKVVGLVFNQDDRPLWGYYGYCQPEEGNHRGNGGNGGNGWRRWLSASLHGRRASWLAKAPR